LKTQATEIFSRKKSGNKAMFRRIKDNLKVLARSTPEDKYMLVTGLKELNAVVAVTGDGTMMLPHEKKQTLVLLWG